MERCIYISLTGLHDDHFQYRINPDPFDFTGGNVGVLLIHGYTGSPSEMRPLGKFLQDQGYTVKGIQLKGHGARPEDMAFTTWRDWWSSAVEGYSELAARCDQVVVAGLSMGGCLSLLLAGVIGGLQNLTQTQSSLQGYAAAVSRMPPDLRSKLKGVVPICTPVGVRNKAAHLAPLIGLFCPFTPNRGEKQPHIAAYTHPFDKTPVRTVGSLLKIIRLMKKMLPYVQVPALILQSRLDRTIEARSANYLLEHIGTADRELKWYERSDHILVLDDDQETVFDDVLAFIRRIC